MSDFIPADRLIAEIQIDLGFDTEKMTPTITRWIYEAILRIGVPKCIIEKKIIKISDLAIQKPSDFVGLKRLNLINRTESGTGLNLIDTAVNNLICVEPKYDSCISCCDDQETCCPDYIMSEKVNSFYFSSNCTAFTHVILEYYAAPIDEDNKPLVPLSADEAVKAYVTYKWMKRKRIKSMGKSTASRNNPVGITDVRDALMYWEQKRTQAEAGGLSINTRQLRQLGDHLAFNVLNIYPPKLSSCYDKFFRNI